MSQFFPLKIIGICFPVVQIHDKVTQGRALDAVHVKVHAGRVPGACCGPALLSPTSRGQVAPCHTSQTAPGDGPPLEGQSCLLFICVADLTKNQHYSRKTFLLNIEQTKLVHPLWFSITFNYGEARKETT